MNVILDKKGFKLFFYNEQTDVTLPVGWTNTSKGMLTKCKKLLKEHEGSYFETIYGNKSAIKLDVNVIDKFIAHIYNESIPDGEEEKRIGDEEKPKIPEIAEHVIAKIAKPGHLFCSAKKCNNQIEIKSNLEYKYAHTIYLVCPECGHKTKVSKVDKTNSLSYAVGAENKGTLIRPDGPKKHMSKKARLILKQRIN